MVSNAKKLFIIGVGRSGTSLLQSMLASHHEIVMMPETSFIRRYLVKFIFAGAPTLCTKNIMADKYIQRWVNDETLNEELFIKGNVSCNDLYSSVSSEYVRKYGETVKYIADKDPKLIEVLPHLNELFRDYKVIHIVRDPRDVLLSKNKAEWSKGQSLLKKLIANKSQLQISEYFLKRNRGSILEIKYEDLLSKPNKTLQNICNFLCLDFDLNMLNFSFI